MEVDARFPNHADLPAPGSPFLGRLADLLTLARIGLAAVLAVSISGGEESRAALVLALAWLSDSADGALARVGSGARLGRWDVLADAAVGAGALLGLSAAGSISPLAAIGAVAVLGGLLVAGNLAAGMLLQLAGYLPFLWMLWVERPGLWWLPPSTAVVIGVLEWRQLIEVNIPNFLRGISGRFER